MGVDATRSDGDVTASYIRDLERRTTGVALGNGVLETRGYDAAGNVVGQSVQRFGTVLAGDSYTYDANGNRLTQRTTGAGRSVANAYAYDATGRVTGLRTSSTEVTAPSAIPTVSRRRTPLMANSRHWPGRDRRSLDPAARGHPDRRDRARGSRLVVRRRGQPHRDRRSHRELRCR
jgi:YD repeat-containing protein